jgi:hypothetical protein
VNDKELLELAAKAAGYEIVQTFYDGRLAVDIGTQNRIGWNPLTDDGDALRLLVGLKLDVHFEIQENWIGEMVEIFGPEQADGSRHCEAYGLGDDHAATVRRAITRAAAEIARTTDTGGGS